MVTAMVSASHVFLSTLALLTQTTASIAAVRAGAARTNAAAAITYAKLADTDTRLPRAKPGAGPGCQSIRCAVAAPCGAVSCLHGGAHPPCDVGALERAHPAVGGQAIFMLLYIDFSCLVGNYSSRTKRGHEIGFAAHG
jgi:hypothetical protein